MTGLGRGNEQKKLQVPRFQIQENIRVHWLVAQKAQLMMPGVWTIVSVFFWLAK